MTDNKLGMIGVWTKELNEIREYLDDNGHLPEIIAAKIDRIMREMNDEEELRALLQIPEFRAWAESFITSSAQRERYAIEKLREAGHTVTNGGYKELLVNGYIKFYPYTGWFSGKGIGDGRGVHNLINALRKDK